MGDQSATTPATTRRLLPHLARLGARLTHVSSRHRVAVSCGAVALFLILRATVVDRAPQRSDADSRESKMRRMMHQFDKEKFHSRVKLYKQGCYGLKKISNQTLHVLVNQDHHLAYCRVAKAGSTFWMQVFRFLAGDFPDNVGIRSFYQINKKYAHHAPLRRDTFVRIPADDTAVLGFSKKFMVTRDPYSRLWASYLDKFFLLDFWTSHGLAILKDRKTGDKKNITKNNKEETTPCPENISFSEFLRYSLRTDNEHWRPVSSSCDPCRFRPDLVVRLETFRKDRDFILIKANLSSIVADMREWPHAELEVLTQVDYNFHLLRQQAQLRACLSALQLARKLWSSFQLNGYIAQNATFPQEQLQQKAAGHRGQPLVLHVADVFLSHMREHPLSALEQFSQKQEAMLTAYRQIPQDILKRLKQRYEADFFLFGYSPDLPF